MYERYSRLQHSHPQFGAARLDTATGKLDLSICRKLYASTSISSSFSTPEKRIKFYEQQLNTGEYNNSGKAANNVDYDGSGVAFSKSRNKFDLPWVTMRESEIRWWLCNIIKFS
ncbi:unnamed protein product [Ceratitis capitata]|uniref:(Mediterranean fruit fly) hypothetical protein n=1 Tax=Ceratitis capitata TaxID=7213 RepID=A0A811VC92_CERCA|nr:unnamed protein product [Ceratitis capitata]